MPRKMRISQMVDSPEALNFQNSSVPAKMMAESHATDVSNNRRAT